MMVRRMMRSYEINIFPIPCDVVGMMEGRARAWKGHVGNM